MLDLKNGLQQSLGAGYSVERELTGGGMSRVFVALDARLGRRVVVKVLPAELAASVSLDRFKREIMLAATLQHPHIVGVLTAGEIDGMPYFTMPFVEGESLRTRIEREGRLPVGRTVSILKDVARALAYAHERGVVHRDIKPDNVLLAGTSATVTDFGIAKALLGSVATDPNVEPERSARVPGTAESKSALTQLGTTLGTPAYMAPEQAAADPSTDHRADIYSFGIMAYEMLTGQVPFKSKTPQALLAAQLTATPPPIPARRTDVPMPLARFVMQCLEKEREKRPQSAREIAELLENPDMVSGAFASAPVLPARRRGVFAIAATLAIVLALAIGAVALVRGRMRSVASSPPAGQDGATGAAQRARSIVVLPFVNIGRDSTDDYLAEGLTNDIINVLGRVPGVRVTSRSVAISAREKFTSASEIGKALNVGRILEGTVQRDGTRLRVTARVTNTDDGFMVWSDMFERTLKDVFAVQDEISGAIAAALGAQFAPSTTVASEKSEHGTADDVAYDLYLRARHLFEQRGEGSLRRALDLFTQAARKDPGFARAYAGVAGVYSVLPLYSTVSVDSVFAPGYDAATRAIKLDSGLAEAYASRAVLLGGRWLWGDAERDLRKAIALDPRYAAAYQWYGEQLMVRGRTADAVTQLRRAAALEPVSPVIASSYAMALAAAQRDGDAVIQARRAIEMDSTLFLPRLVMGYVDLLGGRAADAIPDLQIAVGLSNGTVYAQALLGYAYAMSGQRQSAEAIADRIATRPEPDAKAALAVVQIGIGDTARALGNLEDAVRAHAGWFAAQPLGVSIYDRVRGSARFAVMLRTLGLR